MVPEPFATRLAAARAHWAKRRGGDVDDVAFGKLLGYESAGSISMLQKRISPPPYDRVVEIAKLTGTDPGWLAFGSDSQAPMEKEWLAPGVKRERAAIDAKERLAREQAAKQGGKKRA